MPDFYARHENDHEFGSWMLNSETDIRLLQCRLRSDDLKGMRWEISLISVDIHCAPPYEAVSYVWGDSKVVHDLEVQGYDSRGIVDFTISITASLYAALPYLLATSTTGYLWIDQLCIAQNDEQERNHQVYMMPDIYKTASRVLIWLGQELGESRMLCPLVETLEKACCEESSMLEPIKANKWSRHCLEARSMICQILGRLWFTKSMDSSGSDSPAGCYSHRWQLLLRHQSLLGRDPRSRLVTAWLKASTTAGERIRSSKIYNGESTTRECSETKRPLTYHGFRRPVLLQAICCVTSSARFETS
jgi:hypothetical protein